MQLTWLYKHFDELSNTELYAILKLRCQVFVVEQNCSYQDIDEKDKNCFHLMAWQGDELVAYARLLAPGITFAEACIGRVLTNQNYRGLGIGLTLIEKSIAHISHTYNTNTIRIGAQLYLKKFYESFGFKIAGPEFLEDGIPHIEMVLQL